MSDRCPFCATHLDGHARVCPECNARKGYLFIGNGIHGAKMLALQGVVAPVLFMLAIPVGFIIRPDPRVWLVAAAIGVAWLIYGIRRLTAGPRWFREQ